MGGNTLVQRLQGAATGLVSRRVLKRGRSLLQLSWDADLLVILNLHSPPSLSFRKLYQKILFFRPARSR